MIKIHNLTVDAARPHELAEWWHQATGLPFHDETAPEDDEVMLVNPDGPPHLLFIKVPEGKAAKNRVHVDFRPETGGTRDAEVERLLKLGATTYEDLREDDGSGWVVLLDPEGNEFCVCLGADER
ncbi:VOC family protein [Sphaerisporangium aureirubrum]|uniref:VOC family protein n=1 Tax=Sphaerisporangium aureirubrum TaxID=1544736 RepID=A0ABW1NTY6_9ACTN